MTKKGTPPLKRECSWCGDVDPLVDSDTNEAFPVIAFPGTDTMLGQTEYFHEPCHATLMRYSTLRDAIKATGWTRDEFMMNVDLLASELPEDQSDG